MPIDTICDNCGKPISVHPYRMNHKSFITCSRTCWAEMMGKTMKSKWAGLTPEKREAWTNKLGSQNRDSFVEYYRKLRPEKVKKVIEIMSTPSEPITPANRFASHGKSGRNPRHLTDEWMPYGTCTLIAAHHEMMKDDPERLTTAFMEEMCRTTCKCKTRDKDWENIRAKEEVEFFKQKMPSEFNLDEAEEDIDDLIRRAARKHGVNVLE